ncbi:MAG: hypothetical protein KGN36_01405, partial [Acidobacteriota bacterium]|nr:hypothetical protein [Acidobacteriota bacterium]
LQLKIAAAPLIERTVSARPLWREVAPRRDQVCLGLVKRDWDYGLAYYAGAPLPPCSAAPRPWEVAAATPDGAVLRPRP